MQNKEINTPLTLDDLCSFNLFKVNNDPSEEDTEKQTNAKNIMSNVDCITNEHEDELKANDDNSNEEGDICGYTDNKGTESNDEQTEDNDAEEEEEDEETEEDRNAMRQLRSFPNVAFSRFSGQSQCKPQSIEQNSQFGIPQEFPQHQSFPNAYLKPKKQLNNYCQFNPSCFNSSSTFHSSMNSMMYSNETIHRSMPIRPVYFPYSQYGFQSVNQRGSFPFQMGYNVNVNVNQYPMNYNRSQMTMMYNNSNSNANCFPNTQSDIKKTKKPNIVEDFNTLEELLASLKNGKQIGNYIKARNNTGTMINLIKKLPSNKISELIEMIRPKLKEIMITNNKVSQKLFEQCIAQQRMVILETISDSFIEIALNKWGSYSLQALIKVISLSEEQDIVKKCIEGKVYELAMDKQANFVLQKLVLLFNEKGMYNINEEIFDIFHHLIYNSSGIGLLKNLILANKGIETRKKFVNKTIENLDNIINNSTSHSLLLQLMDKWDCETCKALIMEIIKNIQRYALMKYSSIVVLKCISISDSKLLKSLYSILFRSESVFQLTRTETGNEILRELFTKLTKKGRIEAYTLLELTLTAIKEKNENLNCNLAIPDYVKELILENDL